MRLWWMIQEDEYDLVVVGDIRGRVCCACGGLYKITIVMCLWCVVYKSDCDVFVVGATRI